MNAEDIGAHFIATADYAVIRPASYGITDGRGYLLYWETAGGSQMVDAWTTYRTVAEARAVALTKRPGVEVRVNV